MSDLKRNQFENVNRLLNSFPVVLILGVRQCGKSILSKQIRPSWKYYDIENSRDYDHISADLNFFFKETNSQIIIDSQKLPFGVVINNDDQIRMLSEKIIQIPATYL